MRNASFIALLLVVVLGSSGCSSLIPKRAPPATSGEISGVVSGATPWEQIDSIIRIVNNSRTPQEKDLMQVSGVGVPFNIQTSNRAVTFITSYFVHILNVPGRSPSAYDAAALEHKDLAPFRRIILGLLKLSFENLATSQVNITLIWPDGVITAFVVSQADWKEFEEGGHVLAEQFLAEHSMRMPLGQAVNVIMSLLQAGVDPNEFLNFALGIFMETKQKEPPQQPPQQPGKTQPPKKP